ncbi:hypothetical protein C4566_02415 [Candidatus Parcubacteria bacterium]|nr:MAG: hypothetical protein C4566_02415 [Candidatus Parcubacteria bacterium]
MGNFNRDRGGRSNDRRGGGGSFGRRDSGRSFNRGGGDFGRPTMHKAVCDECGQDCEVPFKPSGDKPIFCSTCFGKQNHDSSSRPNKFGGDRNSRPRFEDRKPAQSNQDSKEIIKAIKTLNYKIDQLTKILSPESNLEKNIEDIFSKQENKTEESSKKTGKKKAAKKTEAKKTGKKKAAKSKK